MSDPNLLPEDLRIKEERELKRVKKSVKPESLELTKPSFNSTKDIFKSDRPQISLYERVFGKKKKVEDVPLTVPQSNEVVSRNNLSAGDFLHHQKSPIVSQQTIKNKNRPGFFKRLFGEPVLPVKSMADLKMDKIIPDHSHQTKISELALNQIQVKNKNQDVVQNKNKSNTAFQKQNDYQTLTPQHKQEKIYSDSWWDIFRGFFVRKTKNILPKPVQNNLIEQNEKPADKKLEKINNQVVSPLIAPQSRKERWPLIKTNQKGIKQSLKPITENPEHQKEIKKNQFSPYHLPPKLSKSSGLNINFIFKSENKKNHSNNFLILYYLIFALLTPIVLLFVVYFMLLFLTSCNLNRLNEKNYNLDTLRLQIGDYSQKIKIHNNLADRLNLISTLKKDQYKWSKFFELLETHTLDGVYFTALSADNSGNLILPGIADNYASLAKQLALLEQSDDFVSEVKLINSQLYSESRAGIIGISFNLKVQLNNSILK